jgi:polysaccharide biosynthesis protein VpsJ
MHAGRRPLATEYSTLVTPRVPPDAADSRLHALNASLDKLEHWVESRHYKGYDPGDGLNSYLRPLALGNRLAERVLLQLIWKSPINLRPLLGVKPMDSTKGRGYMAWGYLSRHAATGDARFLDKAIVCLEWLQANHTSKGRGMAWGNHFDFLTRSGLNPAGSPIIVWSSLIGHAYLEAYERTQDVRWLDVAGAICDWIIDLPRQRTDSGTCLSYVPFAQSSIHNSNMLGAGMLARTWRHTGRIELLDVAREAIRYTCERQHDDGGWWYGEEPKYHWNDSFHTGYNLDSLHTYIRSSGDETYRPHLDRGLRYFIEHFFEADGIPRYYHDRTQPIDIQCAAQAIETLAHCRTLDPRALELSQRVATWTIRHMQDADGHFYYRKYPLLTAKTPYIHWGQATMYKALATLNAAQTPERSR